MNDTTSPTKGANQGVAVIDPRSAPVIYFDGAPNFGIANGILNITLAAGRHLLQQDGSVKVDVVACVFLRCSVPAAIELRNAIDQALLLGAKTEGHAN